MQSAEKDKYLCSWTKCMSKVYSHHATCLQVDHEIGQMSVSNTKNPVADAHQRMGAGKMRS